MHRRLSIVFATVAVALLIPLSSVFADSIFPPSGSYLTVDSEQLCNGFLCTTVHLEVTLYNGGNPAVCAILTHTDLELGGVVYETEEGCATVAGAGPLVTSNGFILGIGDSTVSLSSSLGGSRDATISATSAASSGVTRFIETLSNTSNGCTSIWTSHTKGEDVAGHVIIEGDTFASNGTSLNRATKIKTRC